LELAHETLCAYKQQYRDLVCKISHTSKHSATSYMGSYTLVTLVYTPFYMQQLHQVKFDTPDPSTDDLSPVDGNPNTDASSNFRTPIGTASRPTLYGNLQSEKNLNGTVSESMRKVWNLNKSVRICRCWRRK
jgi:hypothetical protein